MNGVNAQRSNTATRIRRHCASILGVDETGLMRSESRKEKFRHRIGWVTDGRGNGTYSTVDVEILHKNYSGEYSPSSAFLSPVLMGVSSYKCFHLSFLDLNPPLAVCSNYSGTNHSKRIYDGYNIKSAN